MKIVNVHTFRIFLAVLYEISHS